ncbi:uncharacterized protein LOC110989581 [Acanthaster planci]|uniref:Uncharacterized protein LOC110989581 n=1 Tax=Acanthaster planci TaxID=133434 RepID=A0A8B8A1N4_ACAPL|nr:uncharacterized protein LOC110989581 [Acanthaster planci]
MATSITSLATRLSCVSFDRKGGISRPNTVEETHENSTESSRTTRPQSAKLSVTCTPVILEFRRLFQSAKFTTVNVIPGVPNRELLHAVIALYDMCLPDITPEVLYFTVCGKWAKTLMLIRDTHDVAEELKSKGADKDGLGVPRDVGSSMANGCQLTSDLTVTDLEPCRVQESPSQCSPINGATDQSRTDNGDEEEVDDHGDNEAQGEEKPGEETSNPTAAGDSKEKKGIFVDVFSDTESEDSPDSDEDEEDFTEGQDAFLRLVKERRERRQLAFSQGQDPSPYIGIESRLVACATWEKSTLRPGERNVQIDLLAVRKRFRKLGIGKHLLQTLKDVSVVGLYDALVVYADNSAVDFFGHYGFDDDIVLNSKFSDLADNWTNCTLMCYLPPFSGQTIMTESDAGLDLKLMELELQKWSLKSREAHQAQMACAMKLKHEVISLRALVSSQQELIQSLTRELEDLGAHNFHLEKDYLQQQLSNLAINIGSKVHNHADQDNDSTDNVETAKLIQDLERRITALGVTGSESPTSSDDCINWQIAEEFRLSMDDSVMAGMCVVTKTIKANVSQSGVEMFSTRCRLLRDPSLHTKMYLCGTLQHPERIPEILSNGFTEQDFSHGEFGVGLYVSQHASKAAHFSALGKLLLVEVGLGTTDSVVKADNTRVAPPEGFDSIVTPGRLSLLSGGDAMISGCQEYVIFDPHQALPLCLIEYRLE